MIGLNDSRAWATSLITPAATADRGLMTTMRAAHLLTTGPTVSHQPGL
ncbi:hypothetical protein [Acrocarpospora sp. B8E8]